MGEQGSEIAIVDAAPSGLSTELASLRDDARRIIDDGVPENTRKAWQSDWKSFRTWCGRHGLDALPATPETVALYLTALREGKLGTPNERERAFKTVARHAATITTYHRMANMPPPTAFEVVRKLLSSMRRTAPPPSKKAPALAGTLKRMVAAVPDDEPMRAMRDRAALLVGFSGAMRRSEVVGIEFGHLTWVERGAVVSLPWSKTGSRTLRIPRGTPPACPVEALRRWCDALAEHGVSSGPVFRSLYRGRVPQAGAMSDRAVALIVKRCAEAVGMDPRAYAGHSLRAGHVTSAAKAGKALHEIREKTGHKSLDMLMEYIRIEGDWDDDSSQGLL